MSNRIRTMLRGWAEPSRRIGLFLALVAGSAALGAAIAWPLWLFATTARGAYTWFALGLVLAGIAAAAARAATRRRRLPPDPSRVRHPGLSLAISTVRAIVFLAGLYTMLVFAVRSLWAPAVVSVLISVALVWVLSQARRAARRSRQTDAR